MSRRRLELVRESVDQDSRFGPIVKDSPPRWREPPPGAIPAPEAP